MFPNIITILDKEQHISIALLEPPYSYLDFEGKINKEEDAWDEPWPPGLARHEYKICLRPAIDGEVDDSNPEPHWVPASSLESEIAEFSRRTTRKCGSFVMMKAKRSMFALHIW